MSKKDGIVLIEKKRSSVIVKTGRFGQLTVDNSEIIFFPFGIIGFPELTKYCLVDSGDETLILWLQSIDQPHICFPLLEPKIFKPDYTVRLSASEMRELQLENLKQSAVFSILTITENAALMSANLKAPLVINLQAGLAKQVVLQENEYSLRHEMFKELKSHLVTIHSQKRDQLKQFSEKNLEESHNIISVKDIPPSSTLRSLSL